jgi:polyphenol oxidase
MSTLAPGDTVIDLVEHLPAGVGAWITTRHGGISTGPYASCNLGLHVGDDPASVVANRTSVAAALGHDLSDWVVAVQTHGAQVAVVTPSDRGRGTTDVATAIDATDALITTTPGVTLALLVADCVPVLLVDENARAVAVVHAGWRGCAAGVLGRTVATLDGLGIAPSALTAIIGPAIDGADYEVGPEVIDGSTEAGVTPAAVASNNAGRFMLDLTSVVEGQLASLGLGADRIIDLGLRTSKGSDFFSDRAERPCGRFALLARLAEQESS